MFSVELPPNDQPMFEFTPGLEEVHHYHHRDNDGPKVSVKLERNSKGFNYEISVTGARDVVEWSDLLQESKAQIELIIAQEREVTA